MFLLYGLKAFVQIILCQENSSDTRSEKALTTQQTLLFFIASSRHFILSHVFQCGIAHLCTCRLLVSLGHSGIIYIWSLHRAWHRAGIRRKYLWLNEWTYSSIHQDFAVIFCCCFLHVTAHIILLTWSPVPLSFKSPDSILMSTLLPASSLSEPGCPRRLLLHLRSTLGLPFPPPCLQLPIMEDILMEFTS